MGENTEKNIVGIILLNLGGPDSIQAVRPFLYNLFSDRQIIQLGPSFLQKPLAWLISTTRSKKAERFYSLIGGKSPILEITIAQAKALEEALNQESGVRSQKSEVRSQESNPPTPPLVKGGEGGFEKGGHRGITHSSQSFKVYIGMRYWHPLIEDVIPVIFREGIRKLIALSLYPHYSLATSGSSLSKFKEVAANYPMEIFCISSWFDHPLYIEALVDVIKSGLESFSQESGVRSQKSERDIHVLFSAHSLPQKIIEQGDPYVSQIMGTIEEITKRIAIKWHLSYQSRSGPVKWLEPSTDEKLKELAREGVRNILVVPISFVSDHIETLYEIDILYKQMAEGLGINLRRTESLNTHPLFIEALKDMVIRNMKELGWAE